jgi:ABC-type sulfate transport system permease component
MTKWLEGKKTYIAAAAVGVSAVLKFIGVEVPEWIWPMLASFGLGFLRAAVQKTVKE